VIPVTGRPADAWEREAVRGAFARRLPVVLALAAAAGLALVSCGKLDTPARPTPTPEPVSPAAPPTDPNAAPTPTPILGLPAPKPTPTPDGGPTANPSPTPTPSGGGGEAAAACGQPLPPPITQVSAKVHIRGGDAWILDSTPLVGPDWEYCKTIGFTDDRSICPVRPEGHPQRAACELYAVGRAKDTNRPGPTWYLEGRFCTGRASGCENDGENQYLLRAYSAGRYQACIASGTCGEVVVDK
jgi:hypothetical protein